MKMLLVLVGLLAQSAAIAQTVEKKQADLSYSYVELRFVDVDSRGGDGFRLNGSYELDDGWIIVGGYTKLDFNDNSDQNVIEVGGGYVWHYSEDFDLLSTLRFVRVNVDFPGVSADENGFAFSAGARGLLTPKFEVRGLVNHVNLDNSDTYLELAGDYYFTRQFSAGLSLEFAGDTDAFTIGARWFFR